MTNYRIASQMSWYLINDAGEKVSRNFDDPDHAVTEIARLNKEEAFKDKLTAIVVNNGMTFEGSITSGTEKYKEVIDGLYVTKLDKDFCGASLWINHQAYKQNRTHEEIYGKVALLPKFGPYTREHNGLLIMTVELYQEGSDSEYYTAVLEKDRTVAGKTDSIDNIRDTMTKWLERSE